MIACFRFSILLTLDKLKQVIFYPLTLENNYPLLRNPTFLWIIDGLCIMVSQIGGIYIASVLLKAAFLPLLFCSFIGSMGVIQTAMIGLFFYLEFMDHLKNRPLNDNHAAVMSI